MLLGSYTDVALWCAEAKPEIVRELTSRAAEIRNLALIFDTRDVS